MLPNEEFALACLAYYEEQGLIVDATNGQFAHCPLPKGMGEKGYYLLWEHHQQQGLLQSKDINRKCFWTGDAKKWLVECSYWPDNYFELWDIFYEFSQPLNLSLLHSGEVVSKRASTQQHQKKGKAPIQMLNARRKKTEVTFPDGSREVFHSVSEAAISIGGSVAMVSKWAVKKLKIENGKFAGYSARYV